jgi:hypothetical protein
MDREFWTHGDDLIDLIGFSVEARDGEIGTVHEAAYDVGNSYLVVDTRRWVATEMAVLPAGVIVLIDAEAERVYVGPNKDEIEAAPTFGASSSVDDAYRRRLEAYYRARMPFGAARSPAHSIRRN